MESYQPLLHKLSYILQYINKPQVMLLRIKMPGCSYCSCWVIDTICWEIVFAEIFSSVYERTLCATEPLFNLALKWGGLWDCWMWWERGSCVLWPLVIVMLQIMSLSFVAFFHMFWKPARDQLWMVKAEAPERGGGIVYSLPESDSVVTTLERKSLSTLPAERTEGSL